MIEKKYLLFLFLVVTTAKAQIIGKVIDENNNPVPYVNIWVENENIGTTSEENGTFEIKISVKNKVLVFSAVGFETKKVSLELSQKVEMKRLIYELNEVVIENQKFDKEIEIGNSKNQNFHHWSGKTPNVLVKFFSFQKEYEKTKFIKNVIVSTKSKIKGATFKIRAFYIDENGFPGKDALNEDVIVSVKKGNRKNKIAISNFKLKIPKEGIFIGFEWMIVENNKFIVEKNNNNLLPQDIGYRFEPCLSLNTVDKDFTFEYRNGKWNKRIRINDPKFEFIHSKSIEPAINLTLTN